ncbi:hypothetical protein PICSAR85_03687 [Mycobacterium avium subsp. paratuberculosis]|nr:hypothetical protein PICSAR85_03687 [Mycobacterium avium subsp. paratuberculosis]
MSSNTRITPAMSGRQYHPETEPSAVSTTAIVAL